MKLGPAELVAALAPGLSPYVRFNLSFVFGKLKIIFVSSKNVMKMAMENKLIFTQFMTYTYILNYKTWCFRYCQVTLSKAA
jgi:hypothetical protein